MVHRKRFELALERIGAADWERFEKFASAFLSSEFPELRTVAAPSGDGGRDAELFSPNDEPSVVLQYSVTSKWSDKIRDTARKIKKNFPSATQLLYVTNQKVGAGADALKKELRQKHGVTLDVRDRNYFLDRFEGSDHLESVAENLAREIVDPFLESREVIERKAQALTSGESRAALVFLELQWEDDNREKGLTKTVFDALVRTALRYTNLDARLARAKIHEAVCALLPDHDKNPIISETDKSLSRLTKHYIRHHEAVDEFCLTHDESERLKNRLAEMEFDEQLLRAEFENILKTVVPESDICDEGQLELLLKYCRAAMEKFLFQRGELFVSALENGQMGSLDFASMRKIVDGELAQSGMPATNKTTVERLAIVIERVLMNPSAAIAKYLRNIADAYTLLAFLRQTPDVQSAVKKMFSEGEIWIDTSIVLPLLAEDLLPPEQQQFRRLVAIAQEAGLKFRVTPGIIQETERHINRSKTCSAWSYGVWRGHYPYLFQFYMATGSAQSSFSIWLNTFCGNARPEDDISEYLKEFLHITTMDIAADAAKADAELRLAVKEAWTQIHNDRRGRVEDDFDPLVALRLAEHDTENYLGVIVRRQHENSSAFGYTSWWLTLDHMAFKIASRIASSVTNKPPSSPVMSADFLSNYLSFGPLRGKVAKHIDGILPVSIDPALVEYLTPELVSLANAVRGDSKGMPEHVIRRKVRDAMDDARRRTGDITKNGLRVMELAEIRAD
ncbi:MAG: hypothetical protein WAW10_07125 [Gallionella sp.]